MKPDEIRIDEIREVIKNYFAANDEPTRSGLCIELNIDYDTLNAWELGYPDMDCIFNKKMHNAELGETVRTAIYRINAFLERSMGATSVAEALRQQGVYRELERPQKPRKFDLGSLAKYAR